MEVSVFRFVELKSMEFQVPLHEFISTFYLKNSKTIITCYFHEKQRIDEGYIKPGRKLFHLRNATIDIFDADNNEKFQEYNLIGPNRIHRFDLNFNGLLFRKIKSRSKTTFRLEVDGQILTFISHDRGMKSSGGGYDCKVRVRERKTRMIHAEKTQDIC